MLILRNIIMFGLCYLAFKAVKRALENLEAQRVKVKTRASEQMSKMPRLKLDPITGAYKPEV